MTTLRETVRDLNLEEGKPVAERRRHRRHDLEHVNVAVERMEGRRITLGMGKLIDLSVGGMRVRTRQPNIQPDQQIRLRLELPKYAGICPFIESTEEGAKPKTEWVGWMNVTRVHEVDKGTYEVAGKLVDMSDMDRGMLGLYLSTQPMAA